MHLMIARDSANEHVLNEIIKKYFHIFDKQSFFLLANACFPFSLVRETRDHPLKFMTLSTTSTAQSLWYRGNNFILRNHRPLYNSHSRKKLFASRVIKFYIIYMITFIFKNKINATV